MAAILDQGATAIRDALKTILSHVGVSTDNTAFNATQTALDPSGTATNLIKAASLANVDGSTFEATITIDGDSEFTDATIWTIGAMDGATRTDVMTRTVRSQGIGVQAADDFTIGVKWEVQDNS